jgi:hypothetical protein
MTTPGLAYAESADTPSAADADNTQNIGSGTGALVKATGKGLAPVGNIAMDPTQTAELLANMQQMVDDRTGAGSQFMRGLERASAWGSGGANGPAQTLAVLNAQQQKEDESVFGMRQQMAAYKSAAAQQERLANELGNLTGGGGGAGGTGGYQIPPEIQAAMKLEGTAEGKKKIFTDWAKENAKAYAQPDMDKPTVPVLKYDASTNDWVPDMVSPRAYRFGNYRDTAQTVPALQQTAASSTDPLAAIKRGVFGQESGSGTANTSKPNYAGAIGPMQILPTTFDELKKEGLIPAGYDINNPEHNKAAGDKLLEKYYKQYNGDTDKTLAAYYGGPGAINKDGTINTDWKDKLNPNAPTVGQYISQTKQKAGLTTAPAEVLRPSQNIPAKPVSIQAAQQAQEGVNEYRKSLAQGSAENVKKQEAIFLTETDRPNVIVQENLSNRLNTVLNKYEGNEKVVGLLNKPGMASAIGQLLADGISTPVGSINVKGLEDSFQRVIPAVTKDEIAARQEIAQILAQYSLEASKLASGQGSMSDYERSMFQKIAGSTSNSIDLLKKVQQTMSARAEFNKTARAAYNEDYQPGKIQDYKAFITKSPKYDAAANKYTETLSKLAEGAPASAGTQGAKTPVFNYDTDKEARYQKWKLSQGK